MTDFGAFIELEPGIDALLHVSQISKDHVEKPSNVLSIGEEVTSKVVEFNKEDRKISLSIKAMEMSDNDESSVEVADTEETTDIQETTLEVKDQEENLSETETTSDEA
jgi:ribosomal protein S1